MADTAPVRNRYKRAKAGQFTLPVDKGDDAPERMPERYWNPDRFRLPVWMSRSVVERFAKKLRRIDGRLDIAYDYDEGRWGVWVRDHRIQWKWSPGWRLLFYADDLDDDILRRLALIDATRYDGAMHYFRWWENLTEKRRNKRRKQDKQDLRDIAKERWDYSLIKTSMRGPSSGSKFADHHSGD